MGMQTTIAICLIAISSAAPQGPGPYVPEVFAPQPFSYQYGVADDISRANYHKTESQDANGNVQGSFMIALPDGRIQTTKYTADHVGGFVAEVTYQGEAAYPKETKPYSAN